MILQLGLIGLQRIDKNMLPKLDPKMKYAPYDYVIRYLLPIIPKKLTPNQVTFTRLVCTPFLILALVLHEYQIALPMFIVLAFTDMLDGAMARLRNKITDWGKIWDPIADKVLIGSVLVILLLDVNLSLTIFVLAFEVAFISGGTFMKLKHKDVDIQANGWGKIKMGLQSFGVGFLILGSFVGVFEFLFVAQVFLYISLFFAAMSLYKNGI